MKKKYLKWILESSILFRQEMMSKLKEKFNREITDEEYDQAVKAILNITR